MLNYEEGGIDLNDLFFELNNKEWKKRLDAIKQIVEYGDINSIEVLKGKISDENKFVAMEAVFGCVSIAKRYFNTEKVKEIIDYALSNEVWTVRLAAARSICEIVDETDSMKLLNKALSDPKKIIRIEVLKELTRRSTEDAISMIENCAVKDFSPQVKKVAIESLKKLGKPFKKNKK